MGGNNKSAPPEKQKPAPADPTKAVRDAKEGVDLKETKEAASEETKRSSGKAAHPRAARKMGDKKGGDG